MTNNNLSAAMQKKCEVPLPNGAMVAVHVSAMPLHGENLAPIKIDNSMHKQRLFSALYSGRMNELVQDANWRIRCGHDVDVNQEQSDLLDLAAIIADRQARGLFRAAAPRVIALGMSSDWIAGDIHALSVQLHRACLETLRDMSDLGEVEILLPSPPDDACIVLHEAIKTCHPRAILRLIDGLGALDGHPCSGASHRRARVWFPTVGGREEDDCLLDVDVAVRRLQAPISGEDPIRIIGMSDQENKTRLRLMNMLQELRHHDPNGQGKWETLINFSRGFEGVSCELALSLADRIARGREFPAPGRLIATGSIGNADIGQVLTVDGCVRKCRLILANIKAGDRVLLPAAWRSELPLNFKNDVEALGASCALIERIV